MGCFVFPGFYFDTMEITPPAVGVHRFIADDSEVGGQTVSALTGAFRTSLIVSSLLLQVPSLSPEVEVRALVEGQFLCRRLHAERLGYSISKSTSPHLLSTNKNQSNQ